MGVTEVIKPNFFIIGAMKAGTTSLHYYLNQHPQIFMSDPKELWYFVKEKNWSKGNDWYLDHFHNVSTEVIIGESCPDYTMLPKYQGVAERLHRFNPTSKLVYILRDPVERVISHYWYNVRLAGEQRDILTAVWEEPNMLQVSNYSLQLKEYLRFFPRENIYLLTFEELISDIKKHVREITDWLNLDELQFPIDEGKKNVTPQRLKQPKGKALLHKLRYSNAWSKVSCFTPKHIRKLANIIAYREVDKIEETPVEVYNYLRNQLKHSVEELKQLAKRDFFDWKTFYNTKT
ncbi:sulfotransferase family protein [Desulfobacterota bacterium M19]